MIIAREKLKTNIAEYILYMWQIEDIIRSMDFSIEKIKTKVISSFTQPETVKKEMVNWYAGLIKMMKDEGITESGHLVFLSRKVNELNDFHCLLILSPRQVEYHSIYMMAKPNIDILAEKEGAEEKNDINICLTGLYGLLMLKLQRKEISAATLESMQTISSLIANLTDLYRKYETGAVDLETI